MTKQEDEDQFAEDVTSLVVNFAEMLDNDFLWNCYDNDLYEQFDQYCDFLELDDSTREFIGTVIEEATDEDAVAFPDEAALDPKAREKTVRAFLKKIRDHSLGKSLEPFLKDLDMGNRPDAYGNRYGEKVKTFDRSANHYGHLPENEIHNIPIKENLLRPLNPAYVEALSKFQTMGGGVYDQSQSSPAREFIETQKLIDSNKKTFGYGKDSADWNELDAQEKGKNYDSCSRFTNTPNTRNRNRTCRCNGHPYAAKRKTETALFRFRPKNVQGFCGLGARQRLFFLK
jgi:hypothetical protein